MNVANGEVSWVGRCDGVAAELNLNGEHLRGPLGTQGGDGSCAMCANGFLFVSQAASSEQKLVALVNAVSHRTPPTTKAL